MILLLLHLCPHQAMMLLKINTYIILLYKLFTTQAVAGSKILMKIRITILIVTHTIRMVFLSNEWLVKSKLFLVILMTAFQINLIVFQPCLIKKRICEEIFLSCTSDRCISFEKTYRFD